MQFAIGFASDWLSLWRDAFFKPIRVQRSKIKAILDDLRHQLKTALKVKTTTLITVDRLFKITFLHLFFCFSWAIIKIQHYNVTPISRAFTGNENWFEKSGVKLQYSIREVNPRSSLQKTQSFCCQIETPKVLSFQSREKMPSFANQSSLKFLKSFRVCSSVRKQRQIKNM